jgi:hypothetical protein
MTKYINFCNNWKAPVTGKNFKSKTYTCSSLGPNTKWGAVPWLFGKWNYEQCSPAGNEERKRYTKQTVHMNHMVRGKFQLGTANGPRFSLLTHGRRNPSMTTCIHNFIAKESVITGSCRSSTTHGSHHFIKGFQSCAMWKHKTTREKTEKHPAAIIYFPSKVLSG